MVMLCPRKSGFSLIELSIVLVILGLLTGGILAGKSLIRAAELRTVSGDYTRFATATKTFRDKYFYNPGDLPNATAFWGSANTGSSTCNSGAWSTAGTGTQTCNGNGDNMILHSAGGNSFNEPWMYWQHLANAGLIEGTYSGMNYNYYSWPQDTPVAKFDPAAVWELKNWNTVYSGSTSFFDGDYRQNGFWLYKWNGTPYQFVLTPEETWNIDTKLDDGKPGTGFMRVYNVPSCTNAANGSSTNADYDFKPTAKGWPDVACMPYFFLK